MNPLVAATAAALIVAGLLLLIAGARRAPSPAASPAPQPARPRQHLASRVRRASASRRRLLIGAALGAVGWLITGLPILLVGMPLAAVGLPTLLASPPGAGRIKRLEAMEEWTRSLAGVLTVGIGLEQALTATLRSAPAPVHREVALLVARLRARWDTEEALRAFADDLDDATGDLIASTLILGARRRGAGLASVLEGLAESVSADVRSRRQIEADWAKPRSTARWVTLISFSVLLVLGLSGSYIEPYQSPIGQLILGSLLALYVATLIWMRSIATGRPLPRFLAPVVAP